MFVIPFLYFPGEVISAGEEIALPTEFPEVKGIFACIRHRLIAATTFTNTVYKVVTTTPTGEQIQLVSPKSFKLGVGTVAGDIYEIFFFVDHIFRGGKMCSGT